MSETEILNEKADAYVIIRNNCAVVMEHMAKFAYCPEMATISWYDSIVEHINELSLYTNANEWRKALEQKSMNTLKTRIIAQLQNDFKNTRYIAEEAFDLFYKTVLVFQGFQVDPYDNSFRLPDLTVFGNPSFVSRYIQQDMIWPRIKSDKVKGNILALAYMKPNRKR